MLSYKAKNTLWGHARMASSFSSRAGYKLERVLRAHVFFIINLVLNEFLVFPSSSKLVNN